MECIILAGGLGTRLRGVIGAAPKCMAPVAGKPFLHHLLRYLEDQGLGRVILSLGYMHEVVLAWLAENGASFSLTIDHVVETEPLGTGGGIALAMQEAVSGDVLVCNGDTMFLVDLQELSRFHRAHQAVATIALKMMRDFDRYGVVITDAEQRVISFEEKRARDRGLINGGIYVINKEYLAGRQLPERFSFEQDFLEGIVTDRRCYGLESDGYFIDIGVPQDYEQAQIDFPKLFPRDV